MKVKLRAGWSPAPGTKKYLAPPLNQLWLVFLYVMVDNGVVERDYLGRRVNVHGAEAAQGKTTTLVD